MAADGLSASAIGRALGCSKNAVIGKLHRLKVRAGVKPERRPRRVSGPCGILDVTGCKWAIGFDQNVIGRQVFCNSPKQDERYCELHVKLSAASYSDELISKTVQSALKAHKAAA